MSLLYDKDLTIFSVFHKSFPIPDCSFIKPIQVGEGPALEAIDLRDQNGVDNIAAKNSRFCETTALYWIWKNSHHINSEFVGLAHYRRYLTKPETIVVKKNFLSKKVVESPIDVYTKQISEQSLKELCLPEFKTLLLGKFTDFDIILPKPNTLASDVHNYNIKDHFIYHHLKEDWQAFEQALDKVAPEYVEFGKNFFATQKNMHCFGMFIANKQFLINYCEWLFPILFELERVIKPSPHTYQNRAIGFLSERLLNLYVYKNNLKVSEMPITYFT